MIFRNSKTSISERESTVRRRGREGDLVFFQVLVECGKLSAAANRLNLSVSSVSKQLNALEHRLAIQLIKRDAHSFLLTEAGERYYREAVELNAQLDELESGLRAMSRTVAGPLTVATSEGIFESLLKQPLQMFLTLYPEIELSVSNTGRASRLGDEAFDCQILRVDPDEVPVHIQAVDLSPSSSIVCASPDYLNARGLPEEPADLKAFDCLATVNRSGKRINHWRFKKGAHRTSVFIDPRFSGPGWQVREMAAHGLGIARLPEHLIRGAEADGRLVRALPDWKDPEKRAVKLMYPNNERLSAQLERFVAYVSQLSV